MKTIYFIRHGETVSNTKKVSSSSRDELSEKGLEQANSLSLWLSRHPEITRVAASPYMRTVQTAEIMVADRFSVVQSALFQEIAAPKEFAGASHDELQELRALRTKYWGMPGMHISTEENFFDVLPRAQEALEYLHALQENDIAIVTHGAFMTVLLAYGIHRENVTPEIATALFHAFPMSHAGISKLASTDSEFRVLGWNDTTHM